MTKVGAFCTGLIGGAIFGVVVSFTVLAMSEAREKKEKSKRKKEVSAEIEVRNFADTGITCYCKPCRCVEGVEGEGVGDIEGIETEKEKEKTP